MKRLPSNDNFDNLEPPLKVTEEEARKYWQQKASIEAFKTAILPRMNPFLAMKAFQEIPVIAALLSDDRTESQKELWKKYFNSLTFNSTKEDENLKNQKIEYGFNDEYNNILNMVFYKNYGFENSYRRSYMWFSLLCRLIIKVLIDDANKELSISSFYSPVLRSLFKTKTKKPIILIREPIENTIHPGQWNANLLSYDDNNNTIPHLYLENNNITSNFRSFRSLSRLFMYNLNQNEKLKIYQQAPSMIIVVIIISYLEIIAKIKDFEKVKELMERAKFVNNDIIRTIDQDMIGNIPEYISNILSNKNQTMYEILQFHMNIVTTTYPSNPDVGPGIFTGCNICGSKEEFKCNRCEKAVFCGSECFEQHKYKCVN